MKNFLIVLMSTCLITIIATPVFAADVKFSGSYVVQGYYENNRKLSSDDLATGSTQGPSISDTWQRLRLQTDFQVAEGLKLTTRFDAMEKVWGAPRSATVTANDSGTPNAEAENIKFEHVYMIFNVPIGTFTIGYMTQGVWATAFGDTGEQDYGARVKWDLATGPFFWGARWDKVEGKMGYPTPPAPVEHDYAKYSVLGGYKWSTGDAGLQITYYLDTSNADNPTTGYKSKYWLFQPYAKAKLGIVYIETEFGLLAGKDREYLNENWSAGRVDRDIIGWRGYLMANVDLAPAYVGGMIFYASGDDPATSDKNEGGAKIGTDFTPCLLLFNYDLVRWNGVLGNAYGLSEGSNVDNVQGYQIFAGVKPIPKLNLKVSATYAKLNRDLTTTPLVGKDLGYEADITAAYKIYDNLEYMIGFGYLWAGDAFKNTNAAGIVNNDYLLTHKLTLSF